MCQWNSGGKRFSRYAGIPPAPYHGNTASITEIRAKDRTLETSEVDGIIAKILKELGKLGIEIRA